MIEKGKREFGEHIDPLTYVANLAAERANLTPAEVGNIVHRIAELRTLYARPDEILEGVRLVEQRINFIKDGEQRHVEIDTVIRRGDKHYLRDYKPINLGDFERTEAGKQWAAWMESHIGKNFRERIKMGLNPFVKGQSKEIRDSLQEFLKEATKRHKEKLDKYRSLYIEANNLNPQLVQVHVRPYFLYR